jgi:hypothetical protein
MSFTTQLIPSIASAPNDKNYESSFSRNVEFGIVDEKIVPTKGTFGIHFHVEEDLEQLRTRLNGDRKGMEEHILSTVTRNGKPLTKVSLNQVLAFLEFALGDQPYFFLRRGQKTFGLYRKTRNYYYDSQYRLPHRIGFEFHRFANEQELANFNLVGLTKTFITVKSYAPA